MNHVLTSQYFISTACIFTISLLSLFLSNKDFVISIALREASKKDIPNEAYKKKKLGFPVPIREWMREDVIYSEIKQTVDYQIKILLYLYV